MSTSALTPVTIPTERNVIPQPKVGNTDLMTEWWDWICSFFISPSEVRLLDRVIPIESSADFQLFRSYVGNIGRDLVEIAALDPSRLADRQKGIRMLAVESVMEGYAKTWMAEHKTYDYTSVNALFAQARGLRDKVMGHAETIPFHVPEAPKSPVSTVSSVSPGMVNKGNTCYLASLFQGILGDPVTRRWIVDAEFRLDPFAHGEFNQDDLAVFVRVLKECASEYEEAQRQGETKPFQFLAKLRSALDPLVTTIKLSNGKQEDPSEVLAALLRNLNPEGNPLFSQMLEYKVFKLGEGQEERLVAGKEALEAFEGFVIRLEAEGIEGEGVAEGLKAYLLAIDPETDYSELNDVPGILKAVLVKWTQVTEEMYRQTLLVNQETDLRRNYPTQSAYEKRVAAIEADILAKVENNLQKVQRIISENSLEQLIAWVKDDIRTRKDFPLQIESQWKNVIVTEKEALRKVTLNGHTDSNAFEAFLEQAFFETESGYCQYHQQTAHDVKLEIAQKEFGFEETPAYFFLQLCRNAHRGGASGGYKETKKVYLEETFYLDPRFTRDGKGGEYEVRWACVHLGGSADGGHYVNYRKCGEQWYRFDDSTASPASKEEVGRILQDCCLIFASRTDEEIPVEEIQRRIAARKEAALGKDNERRFEEIKRSQFGETKETSLLYLFSQELSRSVPTLATLQKIYQELALLRSGFIPFIEFTLRHHAVLEKTPIEQQLLKLKEIRHVCEKALIAAVNSHIVAQYVEIREQRRRFALEDIHRRTIEEASLSTASSRMEKVVDALRHENQVIEYLLTLDALPGGDVLLLMETFSPALKGKYEKVWAVWREEQAAHSIAEALEEIRRQNTEKLEPAQALAEQIRKVSFELCVQVNELLQTL
ncbi:MAG: ubiquitin carboxyl-terminal hydrolase [Chlamydiia bacterium]|nr:ubiquitin carboxyl-terminal hydrolase [Chlamydiia bacterium]